MFFFGFVLFFSPWQVVEMISGAIGDVVQGLYYENCNNSEVKRPSCPPLHSEPKLKQFACQYYDSIYKMQPTPKELQLFLFFAIVHKSWEKPDTCSVPVQKLFKHTQCFYV